MIDELVAKVRPRLAIGDGGCWIFQGAKQRKGYGVVACPRRNTTFYTHRIMYEYAHGPITPGLQIDHLCRNPACCNPDHLEAVTPAENTRRGMSPTLAKARRNRKTHCKNGHAFTEENSYFDRNGHRSCRECRRKVHETLTMLRRSKSALYRNLTASAANVVSIGARKNG